MAQNKKMKKALFIITVTSLIFFGCKKENLFKVSDMYGTWDATDLCLDDKWIKVNQNPEYETTATFNPDGKYSGAGYFGNGSGTYTVHENTIFVSFWFGSLTYEVKKFNKKRGTAEVTMNMGTRSIPLKIKKR